MGAVALDTNVVIGFLNPSDVHHADAMALMEEHHDAPKSMSVVAYAESLIHPVAEGRAEGVERFFERARVDVVPLDRATARRAAELRAAFRAINIADALVLATALDRGEQLLTFDDRLARARDGAR
jgi:predicted nucleic acid-binding protein